jgi:hypothetical protein
MGKGLGLAAALVLALSLPAVAEEVTGKVTAIDRADHSFVLEDGTRLSASDSQLTDLTLGEKVQAAYETQGNTKVVIGLDRRTPGEGQETTNFGTMTGTPIDSFQSGE